MWNRTVKTFVLLLIVFGVAGAAYLNDKEKKSRAPASNQKRIWMPAPIGKHLALIKVDIESLSEIPEKGLAEVTLKARIVAQQKTSDGVSFRWNIPPEVEILGGTKASEHLQMEAGEILETEIRVRGFNRSTQKTISFQASTLRGHEKLGGSAVIVSRPDETYEAKAPQVREAVDAFNQSKTKLPRGL